MDAAKIYKRGDVIMENKPWVYVVNDNCVDKICHFCFKSQVDVDNPLAVLDAHENETSKLQRCASCRFAYFCDSSCLKAAWKDHKFECHRLKLLDANGQNVEPPDAQVRLASRMFVKHFKKDYRMPEEACTPASSRSYLDLWQHSDKVRQSPQHMLAYLRFMSKVRNFMGNENLPSSDDDLLPIYNRITTNSHTMEDGECPRGTGVYLGASVFDHSCQPNADFIVRNGGRTICIVALEDIPGFEAVRIRYGDIFEPRENRKEFLAKHFFFHCDCRLCRDASYDNLYRSVCCKSPDCKGPVPLSSEFKNVRGCTACGAKATDDVRKQSKQLTKTLLEAVRRSDVLLERENSDSEDVKLMFNCFKQLYNQQIKGALHPLNHAYVKFVQHVFRHYTTVNRGEDLELINQWFQECIDAYRFYDPTAPGLGTRLLILGEFLALHEKYKDALQCFAEAEPILRQIFGPCHFLYKRMIMSKNIIYKFQLLHKTRNI